MNKGVIFLCFCILNTHQLAYTQLFEQFFSPPGYIVYRCTVPPEIDGDINDKIWDSAPWSSAFIDIEGSSKPKPYYDTHFKMLWDKKNLYIAARLYDRHIWATLTQRESVIFEDNDFELFIDPDGDAHNYMELEVNAYGTIWDLFLNKPYRDGGRADNKWNFEGLRMAVKVYGKINRTTGKDSCWTIEMALPWESIIEYSASKSIPVDGEQWRMNFSRVQWKTNIKDYKYIKERDKHGKLIPEHNWVWSPQGAIAMHQPETWGYVQFTDIIAGQGIAKYIENPDQMAIWCLWQVYYMYQRYPLNFQKLQEDLKKLQQDNSASSQDFLKVEIGDKKTIYLAKTPGKNNSGSWLISKDGRLWFEKK
jgi:hypothetical protein